MAEWSTEYYREQLKRQEALVNDVVDLVIRKHGGFTPGPGWIGLDTWTPGMSAIMVDSEVTLNDVKILAELLELPPADGPLEEFGFEVYEKLKDGLKRHVEAAEAVKRLTKP